MYLPHVVPVLARRVRGAAAQDSLLSTYPQVGEHLASNPGLDNDVWFKLTKKTKAPVVVALANNPLDLPRLNVLLKDKRVTVRNAIFSVGLKNCTEEMADAILESGVMTNVHANMWLRTGSVPVSRIKQVTLVEQGPIMLRHLINADMFSEEEATQLMYLPLHYKRRPALHRLLDQRPSLIPAALAAGLELGHLVEAAVGSRHLFDPAAYQDVIAAIERAGQCNSTSLEILLTLISNPNAPVDVIDKALTVRALLNNNTWARWRPAPHYNMVRAAKTRRLATPERGPITVPWDSTEGNDAAFIVESIKYLGPARYPSLEDWYRAATGVGKPVVTTVQAQTTIRQIYAQENTIHNVMVSEPTVSSKINDDIVGELQDRIDPYGYAGWSTFWSLVDNWQGTLAELLDATVDLSK